MAVFTIELGRLLASGFDIGLTDYPIYDETYRSILNQLIKDHFEFREIGQETPALFKKFLNRKLREIMPYYNELYKSQLIVFNPLYTSLMDSTSTTTTSHSANIDEDTTAESGVEATGRTLSSNTPQTQLLGHENYASALADNTNESKTNATGTSTTASSDSGLSEYVYHVAGYSGQNPSEAIMRFRQSLINVNLMVLYELETLFMGLWHSEIGGM